MSVDPGHMVLYDRIDPPLPQGEYRVRVDTQVTAADSPLAGDTRYFNVEGPRFRLAATEVAGVFPPRNGHGSFSDALPHVALGRRTLPWERPLDPANRLPAPPPRTSQDPPAAAGPAPWLALLLLEETEIPEPLKDVPVSDVLPQAIARDLAVPAGATCDAIEIDSVLLRDLLPTVEELHLLTHVREVNVDDRELSAGDSDGWFAVVMSNRLPEPGVKYRACLVSVEGRTDVLQVAPPAIEPGSLVFDDIFTDIVVAPNAAPAVHLDNAATLPLGTSEAIWDHSAVVPHAAAGSIVERFETEVEGINYLPGRVRFFPPVRLILLHSWTFECSGIASFEQLARGLDVGMFSETRSEYPVVSDTGHLPIGLRDRAGSAQTAWYRGPLAPFAVTRDPLGPYHSADQCRRISPETGLEDITYAAAFEVGRLLAASDARLAQELMRWRRGDYRSSVEASLRDALRANIPDLSELPVELLGVVAGRLLRQYMMPELPRVDPREIELVRFAPGLQAARIAEAWAIPAAEARAMLNQQLSATAIPIERAHVSVDRSASLAEVRADIGQLERLVRSREQFERGGRR